MNAHESATQKDVIEKQLDLDWSLSLLNERDINLKKE